MTVQNQKRDDEDNMLAAEYALGVLQGEARIAFAGRMQQESKLALAVRQWDEHFIDLSNDITAVTPPRHVEKSLEEKLFGAAPSGSSPSWWNSLRFWRGLAMASVAALLALGALNLQPPSNPPNGGLVAQLGGETNAVNLVAYYDVAKGELRLNRSAGSAASGRSLELWLIAGTDAPVSLGLLPSENKATFTVVKNLRDKLRGGTLAISDEPQGGSPTGTPTGAVLATGQLTTI
jgi:anti-sigma-K factor RskA